MSWFDNLVRRSAKTEAGSGGFPIHVDLPGNLRVQIYAHEIDAQPSTLPCWSYLTDGLTSNGQKELIFTLRREPVEPARRFPTDPLDLFVIINELAQQGHLVDVGGVTQFDTRNLFGRHLAYVEPQPIPGVAVPTEALCAILVTEDEVRAVQEFGILRVMSRLGFASRYFPCPPWSDRSRAGISFTHTRRDSILARVVRRRVRGVRVVREGRQTYIRVGSRAAQGLQPLADVAVSTPVALLTDLDPQANGCLVWEPGQSGPNAITPPHSDGSRLCGCFALCVSQQTENEVRIVEDGFGLMLTDDAWTQVRQALLQGEATVSLSCKDGQRIVVEQVQTTYWNPIESKGYVAEWQTSRLENQRSETKARTTLDHVRLLDEQRSYERELGVHKLAQFCKRIEAAVDGIVCMSPASYDLLIEVVVSPEGQPGFQLASKGDAPQEELQRIDDALLRLHEVRSQGAELKFQMYFKVGGGMK